MSVHVGDLISQFFGLPSLTQALIIAALATLIVVLALLLTTWGGALRLWLASRAGRKASAVPVVPSTNFARDGRPSDPLNVRVIGTADQLSAAFVSAGWYRADEITFITSLRIIFDAALGRKYSTAPVSDLFLFGRKQDYAFEKPGRSVRERDHVRFWKYDQPARDGRPLWIGGATRDTKVELSKTNFLPTHGIAPDVDDERTLVADDLIGTGWVIGVSEVAAFAGPTQTKNATGDAYSTDGHAVQLLLAKTQPAPLLPQLIRQPGARLARNLARTLRRNLPQQGRDLAHQWAERRKVAQPTSAPESRRGDRA